MAKEHKCGNRACWSVLTLVGLILLLVGIVFMVKPQSASGNDLDYGCNGNGRCCNSDDNSGVWCMQISCDEAKTKCEDGDADYTGKCPHSQTGADGGCKCMHDCGEAIGETVGTWLLGVLLTIIGIIFTAAFSCGICPMCCYAKESVNIIPTQPAMVAQPMVAQPMVAQPMVAQPMVAQPMAK